MSIDGVSSTMLVTASYFCSCSYDFNSFSFYFLKSILYLFSWFKFYLFFINLCVVGNVTAHAGRSEDNLQQSILYFPHVVSGDLTQVITFAGWCLYLLSQLSVPPQLPAN